MAEPEEEILVRPSTELVPDEYEHEEEKHILVHVFTEKKKNVDRFINTLKAKNYDIPENNVHDLTKDSCDKILEDIRMQTKDFKGLLLLFSGHTFKEGEIILNNGTDEISTSIQKLCKQFDASCCPNLKNNPKIFIFEVQHKQKIQMDFPTTMSAFKTPYDTPAEADLLIIYNKYDDDSSYLQQFTDNLENYSADEDIVTIASCVTSGDFRPLIISTLTRRFFFTCNKESHRGYQYKALKFSQELMVALEKVNSNVENKLTEVEEQRKRADSRLRTNQVDIPRPASTRTSSSVGKKTSNPDGKKPWR